MSDPTLIITQISRGEVIENARHAGFHASVAASMLEVSIIQHHVLTFDTVQEVVRRLRRALCAMTAVENVL